MYIRLDETTSYESVVSYIICRANSEYPYESIMDCGNIYSLKVLYSSCLQMALYLFTMLINYVHIFLAKQITSYTPLWRWILKAVPHMLIKRKTSDRSFFLECEKWKTFSMYKITKDELRLEWYWSRQLEFRSFHHNKCRVIIFFKSLQCY